MKDLTFCDAIFIGYRKTESGYDIVFLRDGSEFQLPSIHTERTKSDEAWDKRTGLLKKYGSIQQDPISQGYYFEIYQDQSLKRAPELDITTNYHDSPYDLIGWRNEKHSGGFLAPNGIIPDFGGKYISDNTKVLSLLIPKEMEEICKEYNTSPETLFCDITNNLTGSTPFHKGSVLNYSGIARSALVKAYLQASYGRKRGCEL